jgi:hypothetical protein
VKKPVSKFAFQTQPAALQRGVAAAGDADAGVRPRARVAARDTIITVYPVYHHRTTG